MTTLAQHIKCYYYVVEAYRLDRYDNTRQCPLAQAASPMSGDAQMQKFRLGGGGNKQGITTMGQIGQGWWKTKKPRIAWWQCGVQDLKNVYRGNVRATNKIIVKKKEPVKIIYKVKVVNDNCWRNTWISCEK